MKIVKKSQIKAKGEKKKKSTRIKSGSVVRHTAEEKRAGPALPPAHLVLQLGDLALEVADVLAGVGVVELALDLPFFFLSQAENKRWQINKLGQRGRGRGAAARELTPNNQLFSPLDVDSWREINMFSMKSFYFFTLL